jgi:hypothetical protein
MHEVHKPLTTQSYLPVLFHFINLFFKILMYRSSAHFSGSFRLKGKSGKIFDTIVSTKSMFF